MTFFFIGVPLFTRYDAKTRYLAFFQAEYMPMSADRASPSIPVSLLTPVMVFSEAVITLWFIGVASCYVALGHVPPPSTFNNLIIFFSLHCRAAQSLTATLRGCILQTYLFAVLFRDILYAINNFRVVLCLPSHRILATPLQCGSPARDH